MTGLAPAPAKRPKHRKNDTNVVEICVQSTTIEIDDEVAGLSSTGGTGGVGHDGSK